MAFLLRAVGRRSSIEAGGVGQQLTQMSMIRWLDLVLDENPALSCHVLRENICRERSHLLFNGFDLQLYAEGFSEESQVRFLGEPRCEVLRFVRPRLAERDLFESSEINNGRAHYDCSTFEPPSGSTLRAVAAKEKGRARRLEQ